MSINTSSFSVSRPFIAGEPPIDQADRQMGVLGADSGRTATGDRFVLTRAPVDAAFLLAPRPRAPNGPARGYAEEACVHAAPGALGSSDLAQTLANIRAARRDWLAANPGAPVPTDGSRTLDEVLNDRRLPPGEACLRIIAIILHERPAGTDPLGAVAPGSSTYPATEGIAPAPGSAGTADPIQALLGLFGPAAGLLGGFLSSPVAIPVLMGICAVVPGLQPVAPFVPIIAPIAGTLLQGLTGAAGAGGGTTNPLAALAGAFGQPSPAAAA